MLPFFNSLPADLQKILFQQMSINSLSSLRCTSSFFRSNQNLNEELANKFIELFTVIQHCTNPSRPSDKLILMQSGLVAAVGNNLSGKLGLPYALIDRPTIIPSLTQEKIIKVVLTSSGGFFLDSKGQVWTCGDNRCGTLGLGKEIEKVTQPTKILGLPAIKDIRAGLISTIFFDADQNIYYCGGNNFFLSKQNNFIFTPILINPTHFHFSILTELLEDTVECLPLNKQYILTELAPAFIQSSIHAKQNLREVNGNLTTSKCYFGA